MTGRKKTTKIRASENVSFGESLIQAMKEIVAYERGELTGLRTIVIPITAKQASAEPAHQYTKKEITT